MRRRGSQTLRLDSKPEFEAQPIDCCTVIMLTGPTPGAICTVEPQGLELGRDVNLAWRIDDRGVSTRHARIALGSAGFVLEDLDSTNGTHVNGVRIGAPHLLRDGDRVQLGEHTLLRVSLHDATEQQAARLLYEAALVDPLTGVYNRGHLETVLKGELAWATRHHSPLGIIFIDLDHFTEVNNVYGHQAGDEVLRMMAQAVKDSVRTEDMVARYGGEEFVLVARGIDLNGALVMAERVRRTIEEMVVAFRGERLKITASFGVSSFEAATPYENWEKLVAAADRAVYRAKAKGRNCVCEAQEVSAASWRD